VNPAVWPAYAHRFAHAFGFQPGDVRDRAAPHQQQGESGS